MTAPLHGIRVLDLSRVFSGPFATQMLADLGADVIKVERPGMGDEARYQGSPLRDADGRPLDWTSSFLAMNRGKRSIAIDVANPEGQALVRGLARQSDVFIENFKAGDLARHGLDYASLRAVNPRLVYCSITGFGQDGPRARQPGYDLVFQAMSGIMSMTGEPDGPPQRVGYSVSDITAAYHAVIGILSALHARQAGLCEGQHIDIALLDCQLAAASHVAMGYLLSGSQPARIGTRSHFMVPYQAFDCADQPLVVMCGNDDQFRRLAAALGLPGLADDARYAANLQRMRHQDTLVPLLEDVLRARPRAHWLEALDRAGVPCAPIQDFQQAFDDPQVRHRQVVTHLPFAPTGTLPMVANPVRLSETPVEYRRPPPALGEHTEEICAQLLQVPVERLRALREQGIL